MLKKYLTLFSLATLSAQAQQAPPTVEEADRFFGREDKTGFVFRSITEGDELFGFYAKRQPGEVVIGSEKIYKVLTVKTVHIQNYGCIQLQQTLTERQAAALQKIIIERYKSGTSFIALNREYGENKNDIAANIEYPLENLGNQGREMEKHEVGEMFVVNDPANNSYKVIVKNKPPYPQKIVQVVEAEYTE